MNNPKQNYFLKQSDLLGDDVFEIEDDQSSYTVSTQGSKVVSVVSDMDTRNFDIDHINSQLDAGATIGQAITGEQETMNESTTSKLGYFVDVNGDRLKQKSFLFRKYPEHQALERAIEYANKVGGKVFSVMPRQSGGGKKGELVWNKTMNESKKKSPLNNLIKECLTEVLKEEYQNKKLQERNQIKKILIPLIKESLKEVEVSTTGAYKKFNPYVILSKNGKTAYVQLTDIPVKGNALQAKKAAEDVARHQYPGFDTYKFTHKVPEGIRKLSVTKGSSPISSHN